jgi:outer membrane biosynthesis protein TonB
MTNTERVRAALRKRQDDMAKREEGIAPAKPKPPAKPSKPAPKPPVPKTEKPKQKPAKPPAEGGNVSTPDPKPPRDPDKYRLPDGSSVAATYSAAEKKWTVVLTIPGAGEFRESLSGLFHSLHKADRQYRRFLKAQAPTEGKT